MRILFTGITSFTGMWFARSLANAGHEIVAAIRAPKDSYSGLRAERLSHLTSCELAWNAPFGGDAFFSLIHDRAPFDVLCHHAAEVGDYKSPDFDPLRATGFNVRDLASVLRKLRAANCRRVVLTGSVFEAHEGAGTLPLRAFSAYGLSKTLTAEIFRFYAAREGVALRKFVIANPFGPFEEPRFTGYLMNCWKAGKTARVNTPGYVRDNIPVTLLANAYRRFVSEASSNAFDRVTPSFYAETQGTFARRFAKEISQRLDIAAPIELANQTEFEEPLVRIGTDLISTSDWSETEFWDQTALYYARRLDIAIRQ